MTPVLSSAWWSRAAGFTLLCLASAGLASAQSTPLSCTASATPTFARAGGGSERVSDLLVTCSGGTPTGVGQNVLPYTITLTLNSTVTSRPLATGWSDALLVIDEPAPASQLSCTNANGSCTITGTGTGATTYSGTSGRPNVFQGAFSSGSSSVLVWQGIPLDPPGSNQRRLRFTNLRIASGAVGSSVSATVSIFGQQLFPINNPQQVLATVQQPFTLSTTPPETSAGRITKFNLVLAESLSRALRPASPAGPGASPQSNPGGVSFDTETGFYNPNFPATQRGNLGIAGVPNNGTRVRFRLMGLPAQTTASLPLTINFGSNGLARLVTTDASGIGAYSPAQPGTLPANNGLLTAVYEIEQASGDAFETLTIPVTLNYAGNAPLVSALDGDIGLAPFSTSAIADNSPIPRFSTATPFRILESLQITSTAAPSGAIGLPYSMQFEASGGNRPYQFSLGPNSTIPPGLFFNSAGLLSGVPNTAGTFRFTVQVRDDAQNTDTADFSLTILASAPIQTSARSLRFDANQGGGPSAKVVSVSSSQTAQPFSVSVDAGAPNLPAPAWIQVSPLAGTTPALVTIRTDPGNLPAGEYTARVRVFVTGNQNLISDVTVTLSVKAAPPKLDALPSVLRFGVRTAAPGRRVGFLVVRNSGGSGPISFSAATLGSSRWITSLTPGSGFLRVEVDTAGLTTGIYREVVRLTSTAGNVDVPVVLRISPSGPLLDLNRSGVRFSMREGAANLAIREVRIFNREPGSTLQWNAEVIRGAEYLTALPANGSAAQGSPGILRLALRPATANLPPGTYYGLVRVTSTGALGSPRYIVAALRVRPAGDPAEIDLEPGGVILTGITGSTEVARTVSLNVPSATFLPYEAAASGGSWLTVTPSGGSVSSVAAQTLTIRANPSGLAPGVYTAEVTVATTTDTKTLPITFILTEAASEAPSNARTATCAPNRLVVGSTALLNNFSVPAGWPAALTAEVRDNCGAMVTNATVVARFTNGDPPLTLDQEDQNGIYSATWQPGTALDQANVTISAVANDFPESNVTLVGGVTTNAVPKLFRNGTIHNLDPKLGGLLSPGLVVQIYGEGLAGVAESTGAVPLSKDYKGTSVLIGPYEAPLYYVSPGQLVAQLPSELAPNNTYPIVVTANGAITIPDQVDVVAVQPGVAAFPDGTLIVQHSNFDLVTAQNPAKRGEFLIMYLVGLGATNPAVPSGEPSPGTPPLGVPTIVPTVTIDGAPAETVFTGLTPSGVGLYQINFKVPDAARLNTPLDVVVKQGDYTSNVTKLTVVP